MVSTARELLPLPDSPVITVSRSRGISTSTFLRLCSRAPRTIRLSSGTPKSYRKPARDSTVRDWRDGGEWTRPRAPLRAGRAVVHAGVDFAPGTGPGGAFEDHRVRQPRRLLAPR